MRNALIFLASILCMMPGCSQLTVADYSGFTNIDTDGMPTGWEYEFSPFSSDSVSPLTGSYDVIIAVRYTNNCPSQSVIFNIEQFSLSHIQPDSLTIEIPLFDKDGIALGKSRYGINEITDTIRRDYSVPEGYTLSLSSPLPQASTTGIKSIGLILADPSRNKLQFRFKL